MLNHINFLNIAEEVSKGSKCISKQVGAVIVKEGRILSIGYNGTPKGYKNCCEFHKEDNEGHHEWSKKFEIHAEMNALLWAARQGISVDGADIYSTLEPCADCSKNLIASGVKNIFYKTPYKHTGSDITDFLKDCGVHKEHIFW